MTPRAFAVALMLTLPHPLLAAETTLTFAGGTVRVPVVSLREARFQSVVRQEHDFSCGSAALATLLTHHYGRPTSEAQTFEAMFATGDQQAIQRQGFSMFDMQRYLTSLGLKSDGYRVNLDKLVEVGVPAITLINTKGYRPLRGDQGGQGGRRAGGRSRPGPEGHVPGGIRGHVAGGDVRHPRRHRPRPRQLQPARRLGRAPQGAIRDRLVPQWAGRDFRKPARTPRVLSNRGDRP
ncbi:MAG: cysteine peptidase family C39 domain-containing protein [Magnetospirillum sp.]|nr:cysteine peptidase family C39 domain-containing protein [Magnetospirillum sp.]